MKVMSKKQLAIQKTTKWNILAQRWEDPRIQNQMIWLSERIGRLEKLPPYVGEFFRPILYTVSHILAEAYSLDSMTRRVYLDIANRLPSIYDLPLDERQEQTEKLEKILKRLPRRYAKYCCINGIMQVPEGNWLTANKAKQLLDFIESPEFDKILIEIVLDSFSNSPVQSKKGEVDES